MKIAASLSIGVALAGIAFAQQQSDFPAVRPGPAVAQVAPAVPTLPQYVSGSRLPQFNVRGELPSLATMAGGRASARRSNVQWANNVDVFGQHSMRSPEHQKKSAEATERMSKATELLKSDSKEERTEARKNLAAALTDLFDVMTESREQQIDELERRLEKMREQLEERNDRKQEIVELRLQTIINEANGLTF